MDIEKFNVEEQASFFSWNSAVKADIKLQIKIYSFIPDDIRRYTAAEQWFSNWMVADSPQNVAGVIDDDGATIFSGRLQLFYQRDAILRDLKWWTAYITRAYGIWPFYPCRKRRQKKQRLIISCARADFRNNGSSVRQFQSLICCLVNFYTSSSWHPWCN